MSIRAELHLAHGSVTGAHAGHPPLVLIEWQDAWFEQETGSLEDAPEEYLVRTVGFLIRTGGRVVSVAQELLPDGDGYRAVTHIPTGMIERVVTLDVGQAMTGA